MTTAADDFRRTLELYAAALFEPADVIELLMWGKVPPHHYLHGPAHALPAQAEKLFAWNARFSVAGRITPRQPGSTSAAPGTPRFAVADIDHVSIAEATRRISDAGMPPPTLFNRSGGGAHCYWRLSEPVELEAWSELQVNLSVALHADGKGRHPRFFLRLPGLINHNRRARSAIIDIDAGRRYSFAELRVPTYGCVRPKWCQCLRCFRARNAESTFPIAQLERLARNRLPGYLEACRACAVKVTADAMTFDTDSECWAGLTKYRLDRATNDEVERQCAAWSACGRADGQHVNKNPAE